MATIAETVAAAAVARTKRVKKEAKARRRQRKRAAAAAAAAATIGESDGNFDAPSAAQQVRDLGNKGTLCT